MIIAVTTCQHHSPLSTSPLPFLNSKRHENATPTIKLSNVAATTLFAPQHLLVTLVAWSELTFALAAVTAITAAKTIAGVVAARLEEAPSESIHG